MKAQLVSFQAGERAATGTPLSSAAYDSDKVESYFDQAFVKEDEIGAGDFGRVFRVRSRVSLKRVILHCSHVGPHLGTLVPMGTKISFLVPIWSPFFSKSPFSPF